MVEAMFRETWVSREPIKQLWRTRFEPLKKTLEKNNFKVFIAESAADAKRIVLEEILSGITVKSLAWGGSMTVEEIGLGDAFRQKKDLTIIDPIKCTLSEERIELFRQTLTVDFFVSGSNAVTEAGQLVNLDATGNRVGAIAFGPTHVVILAGRNKIVANLEAAMDRIRNYVAPAHVSRAISLGMPLDSSCATTGSCCDCNSPSRICNAWGIIEKSCPEGRIKVVLINEDLGL